MKEVHGKLYTWFQVFGRDLPWRQTFDPYAILVSEYMLQQTQVETVKEYFLRWMQRFPDLRRLATASEDEVLQRWQGLGYYARAKNLYRAAQALFLLPHFPREPDELKRLPGIGEYTAHAVAAFAFDRRVPVVDANIARVLTRLFNYSQPVDSPAGTRFLRELAISFLPQQEGEGGGRLHTSALMELGALVCKPRKPLCGECPLQIQCRTKDPEAQPVKRPKARLKEVADLRAFVCDGDFIWLSRSMGKWWKGLWILPELKEVPLRPHDHLVKFSVTHHRVVMRVWKEVWKESGLQKIPLTNLQDIAMPAPHRRAVAAMLSLYSPRKFMDSSSSHELKLWG